MASLSKINIKFFADLKQFSSSIQNANRSLSKVGKKMQSVGAGLSVGLTAPIVALGVKSVIAFDKQAKAIAQVEAGIKSTGGAAGLTSKQLQEMASSLQENSLFGDEDILKNVTAQLLTFTNIAGNQFDRTQQAALDLATRLDGDLKSASIQLGKALNDPVLGLSALAKSGIQFTVEQKKVIKSLAEGGKVAEAQTLILDELEKQYGGAAKAAAAAGLGPFKQLSNSIGDLTEDFGKIIVEALIPFISKVKGFVKQLQGMDAGTKKTIAIMAGFAAAIGPVLIAVGFLATTVIPGLITAFAALKVAILANPIGLMVGAVSALASVVLLANSRLTPLTDATKEFADVTASASKNIAKEKVQLDTLLRTARNEKISKDKRIEAINKLNALVPQYNKGLTLETVNTDNAKAATDKYVESLLLKAKVMAAQEKLVDVQKRLLDLQLGSGDAAKPSVWQNMANAVTSYGNAGAFASKTVSTVIDNLNEEEAALLSLQGKIVNFLGDNQKLVGALTKQKEAAGAVTPAIDGIGISLEKVNTVSSLTASGIQGLNDKINIVGASIPAVMTNVDSALLRSVQAATVFSERITGAIKGAAEGLAVGFGELLAGLVQGTAGLKDVGNLFLGAMANLLIQLGKIAIQAGIGLLAIKAAFETLGGFGAIAAGVALVAFGNIIKGQIQDAPGVALAKGGLAFGETLSLIGDNRNSAFDPEVVSPLSKLKEFINPGEGGATNLKIDLDGVLRGTDLEIMISRVVERKLRTQ